MAKTVSAQSVQRRELIPAKAVQAKQLAHFLAVNVLGLAGFAECFRRLLIGQAGLVDASLILSMWIVTGGIGVSVGYHRLFTHRAFEVSDPIKAVFAIAGSMAGQGPVIYWVSVHRRHHQHSDTELDPHTPATDEHGMISKVGSLLRAHVGWVISHDVPSPGVYARDLRKDRIVSQINETYYLWLAVGLLAPTLFGALFWGGVDGAVRGLAWGGLGRLFVGNNIIWSVNSLCHKIGYKTHATGDDSTNNPLIALPSFGEGFHNNHHAFPRSARFGLSKTERLLDTGYMAIRLLELLGVARNVRKPLFHDESDCK